MKLLSRSLLSLLAALAIGREFTKRRIGGPSERHAVQAMTTRTKQFLDLRRRRQRFLGRADAVADLEEAQSCLDFGDSNAPRAGHLPNRLAFFLFCVMIV